MLVDSLALALALAAPQRPALVRVSALVAPPPAVVALARPEEQAPDALTTCYQSRSGSCWTEE